MTGEGWVSKNWQNLIWIAGLLFAAGGAWSEFKVLHKEIDVLKRENEEVKEQLYKEIEQRVDDLEEWKAFKEGQESK